MPKAWTETVKVLDFRKVGASETEYIRKKMPSFQHIQFSFMLT